MPSRHPHSTLFPYTTLFRSSLDTMQDLLVENLRDLHNAENQLIKALPKMAKAANEPQLKKAFEQHLEQTRGQVERDRKSTRLNSSHLGISYAVFCLKKKNK